MVISGFPSLWTSVATLPFSFFSRFRKPNPQFLEERSCSSSAAQFFLLGSPGPRKVSTWLFQKQWTVHLPSLRQAPSHISLLLDAPAYSLLTPSSSLSFKRELHVVQGSYLHSLFSPDISLNFKYSGKMLFLCVYQPHWYGQKGIPHPTHRLQQRFLRVSHVWAIHLLRLLNLSWQELLLPFSVFSIMHVSDMPQAVRASALHWWVPPPPP